MAKEIAYRLIREISEIQEGEIDFFIEFSDGEKTFTDRLPVIARSEDGSVIVNALEQNIQDHLTYIKEKYPDGF